MTKKKARRPKLSDFTQMDRRLRLGESLVKCCGSCQHYDFPAGKPTISIVG